MIEQALAALEANRHLNAAITICPGARGRPGGRLSGMPVLVKDLLDTAGIRTTYGSRIYSEHVPARSAAAVERIEAEGAVVVAKTNADEFAWGVTGQNEHWGDVLNPVHPGRVSGGSSSGNAAALAAGVCRLSLGSDTGGSVRMPAACCGVVGLKPPLGKIPTAGCFPLAPSFDTVGPMGRTVADCALLYSVLVGEPVPEPRLAGLVVGALTHHPWLAPPDAEPERDERALAIGERLEALGARVVEVELPAPGADTWPLFYAEAAEVHRATFPARAAAYGATVRAKLERALTLEPAEVEVARRAVADWRVEAARTLAVDLLVTPTLGVRELPAADVDELEVRLPFSAYTRPFSTLGWPAIAIGEVQLAGLDDGAVLAAALAWEDAYGPP